MTRLEPRYDKKEFARRGKQIFNRTGLWKVGSADDGKFVAIDIETEEYEIDADDYTATEKLLVRLPDAQIWLARVGHQAAYQIR